MPVCCVCFVYVFDLCVRCVCVYVCVRCVCARVFSECDVFVRYVHATMQPLNSDAMI